MRPSFFKGDFQFKRKFKYSRFFQITNDIAAIISLRGELVFEARYARQMAVLCPISELSEVGSTFFNQYFLLNNMAASSYPSPF